MPRGIPVIKTLNDTTVKYDTFTARALRLHLERLACTIEKEAVNKSYGQAFRRIARLIRDSKPD